MNELHYTTDTSDEAADVQLRLIRAMTPQERLQRALALSGQLRNMAKDAIRRNHPQLDEAQQRLKFIEVVYGASLAEDVRVWLRERSNGPER
jgi:hypothetical protein